MIKPSIWGPSFWITIHTIAYNYPVNPDKKIKRQYTKFFCSIIDILPCSICRDFHKQYQKEHPMKLNSKKELTRWIYDFHNAVNDKLRNQGEPIPKNPTFEQINKKYNALISKTDK